MEIIKPGEPDSLMLIPNKVVAARPGSMPKAVPDRYFGKLTFQMPKTNETASQGRKPMARTMNDTNH